MRRLGKITSLILVLLLLLMAAVSLAACNKNKNKTEPDHRAEYCDSLESAVICGLNSEWKKDLSENETAVLASAGSYIVTSEWVKLICDTVEESSLQSAKIKSFADFLESEDGKAMLGNFSENASSLIDLLYEVDFTAEDISSLIYGFVYKTVETSDIMMDRMLNRILSVKTNKFATPEAINNLTQHSSNVNNARTHFVPNAAEKPEMLDALKKAESGISDIVRFAYGISLDSITDNILGIITSEDGALSDVTDTEIKTIISAVASNAASLKAALTKEETDNINAALNLIIKKFDNTSGSSLVFGQIVTYSKYAYMIVDAAPEICDVMSAFAKSIDDGTISALRVVLEEVESFDTKTSTGEALVANASVALAKLVTKISNELGKEGMLNLINSLYEKSNTGDYQKTFPIYLADMIANFDSVFVNLVDGSETFVPKHPEIISSDMLVKIVKLTFSLNSQLNKFKTAYYNDVVAGDKTFENSSLIAKRAFADIVQNPYNVTYQAEQWYSTYVNGVETYLDDNSSKYLLAAKADLEKFVEEYFNDTDEVRSSAEKLAAMSVIPENAPLSTINGYKQLAEKADLYTFASLALLLTTL